MVQRWLCGAAGHCLGVTALLPGQVRAASGGVALLRGLHSPSRRSLLTLVAPSADGLASLSQRMAALVGGGLVLGDAHAASAGGHGASFDACVGDTNYGTWLAEVLLAARQGGLLPREATLRLALMDEDRGRAGAAAMAAILLQAMLAPPAAQHGTAAAPEAVADAAPVRTPARPHLRGPWLRA